MPRSRRKKVEFAFSGNSSRLLRLVVHRDNVTMQDQAQQKPTGVTFRDLYPTLSEQELKEAERNLARYFEIALDICLEQRAAAGTVDMPPSDRMIKERSNSSQEI